jgi:hypothetical protein
MTIMRYVPTQEYQSGRRLRAIERCNDTAQVGNGKFSANPLVAVPTEVKV